MMFQTDMRQPAARSAIKTLPPFTQGTMDMSCIKRGAFNPVSVKWNVHILFEWFYFFHYFLYYPITRVVMKKWSHKHLITLSDSCQPTPAVSACVTALQPLFVMYCTLPLVVHYKLRLRLWLGSKILSLPWGSHICTLIYLLVYLNSFAIVNFGYVFYFHFVSL